MSVRTRSDSDVEWEDEAFVKSVIEQARELGEISKRQVLYVALDIVNRMKDLVPVKTSALQNSIGFRPGMSGKTFYVEVFAAEKYASDVEFGTKPHVIRVKAKKVLATAPDGTGEVYGTKVQHPGTTAQPFFRPAFIEGIYFFITRRPS